MADAAIVASRIGFSYDKPVLEDLSLSVAPGEVVALLGENGAGKTTLLRILTGDLSPRSGGVSVLGGDPRRPAVRRSLGALREVPVLNEHLTAIESLRYTLAIYGAPRRQRSELGPLLDRFDLAAAAKKRIRALSKGMMRRLELAQLSAVDAPAWILDEPDSGLDPGGARLFRELVTKARGRGRAILFSSHSVLDAATCADRIVVLRRGRIAFEGTHDAAMRRLNKRAFVAEGGGPDLKSALAPAAAAAGATLTGPEIPLSALEALLFEDGNP
jgi:ABC-type multidrug transport system ATPase subunit